jgi:flagellin
MSVINTNLSAVAAQNSLRTSALSQTTAMERLSSGIRINSAKDDAAGLAISTRMTANIRGLAAAISNANNGISLTQTAEGSLSSISDNLQRIRELAVQSSNTGNNDSDRAALNNEARQLISEIDRVANNSAFNGIKLLDGSFQNQSLQVGAGNDANDRIAISIGSAKVSALGIGSNSSYSKILTAGTNVPTAALVAGDLSISGAQIGASVSDGVSFRNADGSAIAKAAAINAASGLTGVTATVGKTTVIGAAATSMSATVANAVMINGVDIGPITGTATSAVDRGTQTAAAVNSKTSQTGVTAVADVSTGVVTLTAADGRNITVSSTTAGGESTGLKTTTNGAASALVGILTSADTITINGVSVGAVASGAATAGDQVANIVAAINAVSSQTGVTALAAATATATTSTTGGGFISLSIAAGDGRGIEISGSATALGRAGVAAQASSTTSKITLSTNGPNGIVLGGSLGLAATGQVQGYSPSVLMSSGGVDLSTANGSQAALSVLDKAINTVTDSRASMGAYQNRLTASVANLEVTSMNLQASRSRILDTDYAKETTNLAKSQIIQQAATAMLAQANQSAQSVLALLK